ncbi:pentapeptide repeat-containing protein [Halorientalis pallida]|uniref:pentapeptide repeat-containing protein n=1 Tax=Halorientalis pallida TaxID=2479928 RepID=UPI003C6F2DA5
MTESCRYTVSPDEGDDLAGPVDDEWTCPHESHPDAEYCLFHLPPSDRDTLGVAPGEVRDALLRAVESGDRATNAFVGAHFDGLDLRARTLDADDRFTVDLRGAEIEGTLDLSNAVIEQPLRLDGARIEAVEATDTSIEGALSAQGVHVAGDADFERAAFDGPVDFDDAVLDGRTGFRNADFDGRATFADAVFADAVFAEATFDADVAFRGARFVGDAVLAGTEFAGGANVAVDDADFSGATFESTATFEMARFRAGTFIEATFGDDATFERAAFDRDTTFAAAQFHGPVDFTRGAFDGNAAFEAARFERAATFEEMECEGDVVFADATFESTAGFAGAEFRGGSNLLVDDADFSGATFADEATFHMTRFRYASFDRAGFEADAGFEDADFVRGGSFDGARFDGEARFAEASFDGTSTFANLTVDGPLVFEEAVFTDDAAFTDCRVTGDTTFEGAEFRGGANVAVDDADFSGATFEGEFTARRASFRWARFDEAAVGGPVTLAEATFERGCSAVGATFEDTFDCQHARFVGETDFHDARFDAVRFDEAVFGHDVSFVGAWVDGAASFRGVEFRGGANVTVDDADFSNVTIAGEATFRDAAFRHGRFDDATFREPPTFDDATFRKGAAFVDTALPETASFEDCYVERDLRFEPVPAADATLVDMHDADLEHGRIAQSATGSVYYDLTDATLGSVTLARDEGDDTPLFDSFLFDNTAFEEFDFSRHRGYLERNQWEIHRLSDAFSAATDVRPDGGFEPQALESTYLKAKNGASSVGDNKATSEFFMKEMAYRRRQYRRVLLGDGDGGALSKPRALSKWLTNAFFQATCGYGERPSRVVLVSALVIALFTIPYAVVGVDIANSQVADPLVYSLQSFTSLVLDPPQGANTVVNTLTAFEGFVGGFFIALFVFSLTRSLHR